MCMGPGKTPPGRGGYGAPPPEYAHLTPAQTASPFVPGGNMRAHERGLLAAVGNRAAASGGNPMDAGSLMENGTHLMFENQNSTHLLRIYPDGRVDFSGVLMNHRETMVRVLRAPDGVH